MSLHDLKTNEDWHSVPRNDVERQREQLRQQLQYKLRNCAPEKEIEALQEQIARCDRLLGR